MWPLLLAGAAGAVFWTLRAYDRTLPSPPARLRRTLATLRSIVVVLLVAAIAGPVISLLRNEIVPAHLVVVIEDSGSMAIPDHGPSAPVGQGVPQSRWDGALALGAELDSVFSRHASTAEVVFLRGNGLDPVSEFRLDDPVIPAPTSHGTDLGGLVRQVRDRMAGRSVRSLVLISDGQETRGSPADRGFSSSGGDLAVELVPDATGSLPLEVVGVGDLLGTADRIIKDLRYPDTAYEGDELLVEFAVDHRFAEGALGTILQAQLVGPEGVEAQVTLPVTDRVMPVSLSFQPDGHGLQVYSLEVSALDNESFLDNNRASLAIDVRKERSRLILLTGVPGWDVRFLSQAAANEERIQLEIVHPTASGLAFADSLVPWVSPSDPAGWSDWDGVILSGWTEALAGQNWEPLRIAVQEGLGLLVIPGPAADRASVPVAPPPVLADLLPVKSDSWKWSEGPLFARVVPSRAGHPILEGLQEQRAMLEGAGLLGLPPLRRIVAAEARPGAVVLMTGRRRVQATEEPGLDLLVVQAVDRGRMAWFGGRNLWELSFWDLSPARSDRALSGGDDRQGRRLLRNLLVWTATGEEQSGLVFTGRQTVFQEGERIKLAAQWRDMRGRPVVDEKLSLQLRPDGAGSDSSLVRTFALSRSEGLAGFAEVVLPPLPPGRYTVQLVGDGDPPVMGRVERLVVSGHSIESTQVRMDRRRLVQAAARGGGDFYLASSAAAKAQLIDDLLARDWTGEEVGRRNRLDFWSGWPFLCLVAALLGWEWFLRRRNGLL